MMTARIIANRPTAPTEWSGLRFLHHVMWPICYAGLGSLVAWSMLQPGDSVSVFVGHAVPQNLGWLLLAWMVSMAVWISGSQSPLRFSEMGVLFLILVGMLFVTIHAGWHNNPRTGWNGFWHIAGLLSFYCSLRSLLNSHIVRSVLAVILFAGSVSLAIEGVYQLLIEFPEQRRQYVSDPQSMLKEIGINATDGNAQRMRFEARLNSPEPRATYALTNSLAVQLSGALVSGLSLLWATLPIGFWKRRGQGLSRETPSGSSLLGKGRQGAAIVAKSTRLSQGKSLLFQSFLAGQIMIVASIWLATRSRAAFLAVAVAILLGLIWRFRSRLRSGESGAAFRQFKEIVPQLCCIALGSLAAFVALWTMYPDWLSAAVRSATFRRDYWIATWQMLVDHGWSGVGLGNFQSYYPRYMLPTASETIADPHNWVLDLAVTCSVPMALVISIGLIRLLAVSPLPCSVNEQSDSESVDQDQVNACSLASGAGLGAMLALAGIGLLERPIVSLTVAMVLAGLLAILVWPLARQHSQEIWWGQKLAAVTMLICLLASGSWQAPGLVVGLLCYLVSGAVAWSEKPDVNTMPSRRVRQPVDLLVPSIFTLLLVGFIWQSWNPVLKSGAEVHGTFPSSASQREAAERAAQLDPWDAGWNRYQIELLVRAAAEANSASDFERWRVQIEQSIQSWTKRESISFLTWQRAGEHYLELAAEANQWGLADQPLLQSAAKCYENAIQAYPTSVQLRIQLAYSKLRLNDLEAADRQLGIAERLDQGTPHLDRKISSQLIWIPEPTSGWSEATNREQYWRPAEPAVAWIRSQL